MPYEKYTGNKILDYKKPKAFPLKLDTRQKCLLLPLLLRIVVEDLAREIGQEKKN